MSGFKIVRSATLACCLPAVLILTAHTNPNRAPIGVFIGLGMALVIVVVVLFFTIPISSPDYRYGGTSYYSGPFGGFGGFGFGGL